MERARDGVEDCHLGLAIITIIKTVYDNQFLIQFDFDKDEGIELGAYIFVNMAVSCSIEYSIWDWV